MRGAQRLQYPDDTRQGQQTAQHERRVEQLRLRTHAEAADGVADGPRDTTHDAINVLGGWLQDAENDPGNGKESRADDGTERQLVESAGGRGRTIAENGLLGHFEFL